MADPVVHVIDDDEAVRHALAFLLASSGFPVRIYDSALAFLDALTALQPGCVLTDVRMPGMSGLDLQRELMVRRIVLPVIVMTGHGDVALAVEAMKAGAIDFIEKPFSEDRILTAIRAALDRSMHVTVQNDAVSAVGAKLNTLTAREREVLAWAAKGKSASQISQTLRISKRTVDEHTQTAARKLGAANRTQAVAIALRDRIIEA